MTVLFFCPGISGGGAHAHFEQNFRPEQNDLKYGVENIANFVLFGNFPEISGGGHCPPRKGHKKISAR